MDVLLLHNTHDPRIRQRHLPVDGQLGLFRGVIPRLSTSPFPYATSQRTLSARDRSPTEVGLEQPGMTHDCLPLSHRFFLLSAVSAKMDTKLIMWTIEAN